LFFVKFDKEEKKETKFWVPRVNIYPVLAPFTLCISLREREVSVAHFFPMFAREMEIHVAILVSSAAEGFRRSGSSRQCFAASMPVFVKLKLVGDFFFCCFAISFGVVSFLFGLSALQFEMSFLFGVLLVLDLLSWMCLHVVKHLPKYFLLSLLHTKYLQSAWNFGSVLGFFDALLVLPQCSAV
jgi:hypothetical protein